MQTLGTKETHAVQSISCRTPFSDNTSTDKNRYTGSAVHYIDRSYIYRATHCQHCLLDIGSKPTSKDTESWTKLVGHSMRAKLVTIEKDTTIYSLTPGDSKQTFFVGDLDRKGILTLLNSIWRTYVVYTCAGHFSNLLFANGFTQKKQKWKSFPHLASYLQPYPCVHHVQGITLA